MRASVRWVLQLLGAVALFEGTVRVAVSVPSVQARLFSGPGGEYRPRLSMRCADRSTSWGMMAFDEVLGWAPQPDAALDLPTGRVSHDARGFRLVPTEPAGGADPAPRQRVVLLGDSFTYGEDVGDTETFAAALAARRPDLEVLDLGVPGYAHEQMLLRWRRDARPLAPDVVVLGFVDIDLDRDGHGYYGRDKPWARLVDGELVWEGQPVPTPVAACEARRRQPWALLVADLLLRGPAPRRLGRPAQTALGAALVRTLREEVEASGARFLLLRLPLDYEVGTADRGTDDGAWQAVRATADDVLDPLPLLRQAVAQGVPLKQGNHYSPEANARIGGWLDAALPAL